MLQIFTYKIRCLSAKFRHTFLQNFAEFREIIVTKFCEILISYFAKEAKATFVSTLLLELPAQSFEV
jgi:hypothetical protein